MKTNSRVKILVFGHGGAGNRGCEAIIKSTVEIIEKLTNNEAEIYLISTRSFEDKHLVHNSIRKVIDYKIPKKFSPKWYINKLLNLINRELSFRILFREIVKVIENIDIAISVGGDNYCYGEPYRYYTIDNIAKKNKKKLVLWGASIEPDMMSEKKCEDLRKFDLIVARDSITYNALKEKGINKNTVLYPDPAFTLIKEDCANVYDLHKIVGINLSPLVLRYEANKDIALKSVKSLITFIINETDYNVLLIPHVTQKGNNDYTILRDIYNEYNGTNRINLVSDKLSCNEYKGYISKCDFLLAARTHASIAGYSSFVPTLVLGYSVKAKGIAKDIFGTFDNFVLPIQQLNYENELVNAFIWLKEHENETKAHLMNFMPPYIERARQAGEKLKELIKEFLAFNK